MKEAFYVFRYFGFIAGLMYLWDTFTRTISRLLNSLSRKRFPIRFEDLSDEDAQMAAWAAGVADWGDTREELNKAWNDFVRNETFH